MASYENSFSAVTVNLRTDAASGSDAKGDKLKSIESISGSDFGDGLSGNGGDDILDGLGNKDTLIGGSGKDKLFGGSGSDTLDGGKSNDRLVGGGNADVFVFKKGYRQDTIKDLSKKQGDQVDVTSFKLKNFKQLKDLADKVGDGVVIDFGGRIR